MKSTKTRNKPRQRTYTATQEQREFAPFQRGDDIITYAGTVKDDTETIITAKNDAQLGQQIRDNSDGAIASNIRRLGLASPDFQTGEYTISKAQVKDAAKQFVYETIDAGGGSFSGAVPSNYSYDYRIENQLSEAKELLSDSWTVLDVDSLDKFDRESLINTEKAYQARAILETARVGKVRLTDAQIKRLEIASEGGYTTLFARKREDPRKRAFFNDFEKKNYLEELRRNDII